MPSTPTRQPDGSYSYGPEGFVPKDWRWVTADDPLAPGDAWWNGHFNPYSLIVQADHVGESGFYRSWAVGQIDNDKVGYFVAQWSKGNTNTGNMTPDEILQASQVSDNIATSKVMDKNLGGYEAAMAWLASADQQTSSQINSWLTDERNNPPPPDQGQDQQQDQTAADDGQQQNLDNTDQNAQTGDMGDDEYYSDEEWYADQMAAQDYTDESDYGYIADTGYTEADYNTEATDYTDYSDYGYQDLGGGQWYDPSDNSTYDENTGQWTYADESSSAYDTPATDETTDYAAQGLEDLGDNMWFNPNDGSVYDADTGVTTPGWGEQDSFVDPISGTTFYEDGSFMLPDGTTFTADGDYVFEDGTKLLQNGDYVDASGQTWESMAYAGAPNVWQNTTTGDTWNMNDGTYVASEFVPAVEGGDRISYDQFLAQQKQSDPANYARLTQPTTRPGGSSGGGSGGGSGISLGGGGKSAGAAGGVTLADLNKLLQTAAVATQAVVTAKNAGAPANQLAALQRTAQQAALAASTAKAAGIATGNVASPISTFLKQNSTTLLIAGAAVVALLLITGRKSTPTPAANVAA